MSSSFGTNEEIVDDLTKDLKQSSIDPQTNHISPESLDDKPEDDLSPLEAEQESDPSSKPDDNEEELIDEESLQERDAQLSSEEKEVRYEVLKNLILVRIFIFLFSEFLARSFEV